MFEGAQGTLLDVLHGTYPFVTSSHTVAGAVCTSMGIGPGTIQRVVAVSKAYTTRVGMGPFPTELHYAQGDELRQKGGEFGATTGRPRRCGWLDLVALKHAVQINGATEIALTKADVLSGISGLSVCTAYRVKSTGQQVQFLPWNLDMEDAEPVLEPIEGWEEDVTGITAYDALPQPVKSLVELVERHTGVPVSSVSVGPGREQTILRDVSRHV